MLDCDVTVASSSSAATIGGVVGAVVGVLLLAVLVVVVVLRNRRNRRTGPKVKPPSQAASEWDARMYQVPRAQIAHATTADGRWDPAEYETSHRPTVIATAMTGDEFVQQNLTSSEHGDRNLASHVVTAEWNPAEYDTSTNQHAATSNSYEMLEPNLSSLLPSTTANHENSSYYQLASGDGRGTRMFEVQADPDSLPQSRKLISQPQYDVLASDQQPNPLSQLMPSLQLASDENIVAGQQGGTEIDEYV